MQIDMEKRQAMGQLLLRHYDFVTGTMNIKLTETQKHWFQDCIDEMKDQLVTLTESERKLMGYDLRFNLGAFKKALKSGS
jgi:hypothetical protein